jgi:WD40 repeat protein
MKSLKNGNFASGSWDKTIKIWDQNNFKCIKTLNNGSLVLSLAESNGKLISGSEEGGIKIWNSQTFELLKEIDESCIRLEVWNGLLVSGSDGKIKILKIDTLKCIKTLRGHAEEVCSLAVLENGNLASGSPDKTIRIWERDSYRCLAILEGHTDWVKCLAALENDFLASGSWDRTIRIWDMKRFECFKTIRNERKIECLAVLDNRTFASGSKNIIQLWDIKTFECTQRIKVHNNFVNDLIVLKNATLVSCSDDKAIKIWKRIKKGND